MVVINVTKCSFIIILLLTLSSCLNLAYAYGINEETKTYNKSFTVNESTTISLTNRRGNIEVIYREGKEAEIQTNLTVRGDDDQEIQKILDQFELSIDETGQSIEVEAETNISSWSQVNALLWKSNVIKFKDGTKANDIKEIDVQIKLYIPKIKKLITANKYHDIIYDDMPCDLEVNLYSGKLKGDDIDGDLKLKLKYGKVQIGTFKGGEINIYDSKFKSSTGGNVEFKSKYSDINCQDFESLDLDSYDDDIAFGSVNKNLDIKAKYSNIKLKSFGEADFDVYDTDIDATDGSVLKLKSKYGSFTFDDLAEANLKLYDDNFEMDSLINMIIEGSKYSDIDIDNFSGAMNIISSYDDDIHVLNSIRDFEGLSIKSKYSNMEFPILSDAVFQINADTKYGTLNIGDYIDQHFYHKDGETLKLKGKSKGANQDSPMVIIDSYDSKIIIIK